jgi:hypothetical protein
MRGLRTSNYTDVEKDNNMALTRVEEERITDVRLKLQSAANSLKQVDAAKIPQHDDIEECLDDADKSLGNALRSPTSKKE